MNHDDALLDRYLLGRTSAQEAEALELRLLEDSALFESAEAAEFELLERYSRGLLGSDDQATITARLEGSPRLRDGLAFSRALIDIARTTPRARHPTERSWLSKLFAPAARPAWTAAALASFGAIWLGSQNVDLRQNLATVAVFEQRASTLEQENQQTQAALTEARERARLAAEEAANFREKFTRSQQRVTEIESRTKRNPATLSLTAITRSAGSVAPFVLEGDKTHVQIDLDLPDSAGAAPWTAVVKREGVTIWTETDLSVNRNILGVIGTLEIPRQSLEAGRYEIVVRSATGPVATFPLTVERP